MYVATKVATTACLRALCNKLLIFKNKNKKKSSHPYTEPLKHYSAQVSQPVSILFVIDTCSVES